MEKRRGLHVLAVFRSRLHCLHRMDAVLQHIVFVILVALIEAFHRVKLGEHFAQHVYVSPHDIRRILSCHQFPELRKDPLHRQLFQQSAVPEHRRLGLLLDPESQYRCKSHRAHYPERVLSEPLIRISHCTQHVISQVFRCPEDIRNAAVFIHHQCIHRKIPAFQVLLERSRESYAVRVPAVGISRFCPVRRYLERYQPHVFIRLPGCCQNLCLILPAGSPIRSALNLHIAAVCRS